MKNKRNLMRLGLVLGLIAAIALGTTLAWLVDTSDPISNVLLPGTTTADVGETGDFVDGEGNPVSQPAIPGETYAKSPYATLKAGSIESWMYIEVEMPLALYNALDGTAAGDYGSINAGWTLIRDNSDLTTHSVIYGYTTPLDAYGDPNADPVVPGTDQTTSSLFNNIKFKTDADIAAIYAGAASLAIDITAFSIQKEPFTSALNAYDTVYPVVVGP